MKTIDECKKVIADKVKQEVESKLKEILVSEDTGIKKFLDPYRDIYLFRNGFDVFDFKFVKTSEASELGFKDLYLCTRYIPELHTNILTEIDLPDELRNLVIRLGNSITAEKTNKYETLLAILEEECELPQLNKI